ncbi:hypothetical protein LINPERPRIM_LOCUS8876 [Linum perenne]
MEVEYWMILGVYCYLLSWRL